LGLGLPSGSRNSAGLLRKYKGNSSYENLVLLSAEISLSSSLLLDKGTLLFSKYFSIDLGGWIILGWVLERWDWVMWTGLVWLRIGTGGELL
jgi:hypothetical protein